MLLAILVLVGAKIGPASRAAPSPDIAPLPAVSTLAESHGEGVPALWLAPKARLQRCVSCLCRFESQVGQSACCSSPSLDATTANVGDSIGALSIGSRTLTLGLSYSSDLADGTNTVISTTMGLGWTHSYAGFLTQAGANIVWIRGNLEVVRFNRIGAEYSTSTGQFMRLEFTGEDTIAITLKEATVYSFRLRNVVWNPDGEVYTLESIIDPNERADTFEYDANGLLVRATDSFGNVMQFAYGPGGLLMHAWAADRHTWFEYEGETGQLSGIVMPDGERLEYDYNFLGQMTAKRLPSGLAYTVHYNQQNKAFRMRDASGAIVVTQRSDADWQPDHQQSLSTGEMHYKPGTARVTDARGNTWKYEYNARGLIHTITDPHGKVTANAFDPATLYASEVRDANGNPTSYTYDARGNRTSMRDAEGNETLFEYEPVHNNLRKRTEPDGDEWIYHYDDNGNLTEVIDPLIEQPIDATERSEYYGDGPSKGLLHKSYDRNGNVTEWIYNADGSTQAMIDPAGAVTSYTYDPFGNMLTSTLHNDSGDQISTFTYDADDRIITMTDALGHTTKYDYDADGNRIAMYSCWIDDSTYRSVTRYEYDHRGRLVKTIEDADGFNRTTEFEYDANDNRVRSINPNGIIAESSFDTLNRLISTLYDPDDDGHDGLEIEQSFLYDPVGNTLAETDPNGHTTLSEYDSLNRLSHRVDPLGNVTEFRYVASGGGGGGCGCGTPGSSVIKCMIDAEGKVTQFEYDALDRRIREIRQVGDHDCDLPPDGDDAIATLVYDPNGNVLVAIDPNGNTTTSTYTARDQLESTANGCGEDTFYEYDLAGNLRREYPPNGNIVIYEYDALNRLVYAHDSLGDLATISYDCVGNQETVVDGLGHGPVSFFDNLNRLERVVDAMGQPTEYEYDLVGNLLGVTDREGNRTKLDYDAANRRTTSTIWPDADGGPAITVSTYDPTSNLKSLTDANGNTTSYDYDAADRLITETFADETTNRFTYDGVGNMTTREDAMGEGDQPGNITDYAYDDLHRLRERSYATGLVDAFDYDAGGRMTRADNNHSHIGYTYDCADRILTSTQTDLPETYSYVVGYEYDVFANTRTLHYPSGKVVIETLDQRGRLAEVSDAAIYAYDVANRVLTKTLANGTEARFDYNDNDWVRELRHMLPDGLTTFAGFRHYYDREGNRLSAENLQQSIPYDDTKPVTQSEAYAYDDAYRLADYQRGQWADGSVANPRRSRTWNIDPVHNWTTFSVRDLDTGENATYCNSINEMNEYDDPSTDGPCPVPDDDGIADDFGVTPCLIGAPFDLTADGIIDTADLTELLTEFATDTPDTRRADLTGDGAVDSADLIAFIEHLTTGASRPRLATGQNRTHDKNGSLVADATGEYYYDHQTEMDSCLRAENRLTLVKDRGAGDVLGEYWYDAHGRRVRRDAGGTSTIFAYTHGWRSIEEYEDSVLARSYTFGTRLDEVLNMERASEADRFYDHASALGCVVVMTDQAGMVAERYAYDAYGTAAFFDPTGAAVDESAIGNPHLFTGRRLDSESGWYYYRTRYFDPHSGRFTTRDTVGSWYDALNVGNGYAYVGSNPWRRTDPFGLGGVGTRYPLDAKPIVVLPGKTHSETHDIWDPKDKKYSCGKVTIDVEVAKETRQIKVTFTWKVRDNIAKGKCCFCGDESVTQRDMAWVQHVIKNSDGDDPPWRFDNGEAGRRSGHYSDPGNPGAGAPGVRAQNPTPWYGGEGNETERLRRIVNGPDRGAGYDAAKKQLQQFDTNPLPQQRIVDTPAGGLGFLTQLVCVDTLKKYFQYGWTTGARGEEVFTGGKDLMPTGIVQPKEDK